MSEVTRVARRAGCRACRPWSRTCAQGLRDAWLSSGNCDDVAVEMKCLSWMGSAEQQGQHAVQRGRTTQGPADHAAVQDLVCTV